MENRIYFLMVSVTFSAEKSGGQIPVAVLALNIRGPLFFVIRLLDAIDSL